MSKCRSLSDALATLPNLSDKIIKSDEQYCKAGGFSDVYKRQCKHDSGAGLVEVAVKSFRFLFTLGETEKDNHENRVRKMIRRELGIWRRLEHPNIVPFLGIAYGFGRQEHASLVSLWMANGSLQSFLVEHAGQLTIAHRLHLSLDIANGLCYLHSFPTPIIHGDLSCNNVLLDHNYIARLTDFGYASMIGELPEASAYLQMTTMKPGTLRWAAPEHFLADEEQTMQSTTQSDIYSFGNLGLLVLSGKHPWSEFQRDASVVVQLTRGNKPKRPSSPPIEDQHWELIERCWSSVGDRPCAEDAVSSLEQFLHSFLAPLPLVDIFRVLPHSTIGVPDHNTDLLPTSRNLGSLARKRTYEEHREHIDDDPRQPRRQTRRYRLSAESEEPVVPPLLSQPILNLAPAPQHPADTGTSSISAPPPAHSPPPPGQTPLPAASPATSASRPSDTAVCFDPIPVQLTDDAASKETQYIRRRCFNCDTTEPPSWRRSTLNPGNIVCNKCGLYERIHHRPRPLRSDKLRADRKTRKTTGNNPADKKNTEDEPSKLRITRRNSASSNASGFASDWNDNTSGSSSRPVTPGSAPSPAYPSPAAPTFYSNISLSPVDPGELPYFDYFAPFADGKSGGAIGSPFTFFSDPDRDYGPS